MSYAHRFLEKVESSKNMNEDNIPLITEDNFQDVLKELLEEYGHHIHAYLSLQGKRCNCDNIEYMVSHLPESPDDWLQKMTYMTQAFYKLAHYYKLSTRNGYDELLKITQNSPDTAIDSLMQEFEKGWDATEVYYGS